VKESILPEWWEDDLAHDAGTRRLAAMAISRTLKIPLQDLVDSEIALSLERCQEVRFKHWQDVEQAKLLPAVTIARRVCELLASCATNLPQYRLNGILPGQLRERILAHHKYVTLPVLVRLAWDFGVPVVYLNSLPTGSKRVDGMAFTLDDGRPFIALASSKRSPAFLIWHLAHELGHIASGHLEARQGTLDVSIDFGSINADESEANRFALDVVYGEANRGGFSAARYITGENLAKQARNLGPMHRIYPPCIVSSYGHNMPNAWATVNRALQIMGAADNGPDEIRSHLGDRLDLSCLGETDRHFFAKATGIQE
jgi:hypothetical protein